jgi:hypothetical protein
MLTGTHLTYTLTLQTTQQNTTQQIISHTPTTTNLIPSRSISFYAPSQYHTTAACLIEFSIRGNMLRNETEEK